MVLDNEWVAIPGGRVMLGQGGYLGESAWFAVEQFEMARYPVTNAQYAPVPVRECVILCYILCICLPSPLAPLPPSRRGEARDD